MCQSLEDWHGEAYFGRLLQGDPRVVELLDAFVTATGRGQRQRRRHVLVFEHMAEGTVWDAVERDGLRWSEGKVRAEIRALLKLLRRMHGVWVIHRDIKPDNVYLRDGRLVLGDFGITKLALDQKAVGRLEVPARLRPARPRLQHACGGRPRTSSRSACSPPPCCPGRSGGTTCLRAGDRRAGRHDAFKSWIWHATGARSKRYWHADDALDALSSLRRVDVAPGRAPRSLRDQPVVFSGRLDGMTRATAIARARAAGAHPQPG